MNGRIVFIESILPLPSVLGRTGDRPRRDLTKDSREGRAQAVRIIRKMGAGVVQTRAAVRGPCPRPRDLLEGAARLGGGALRLARARRAEEGRVARVTRACGV